MADILELYGNLLQRRDLNILRLASSLPATMPELKKALIAEAQSFQKTGLSEGMETVRACYAQLANFVPDDVALRDSAADLAAAHQEMGRLIAEFDLCMKK